MGFAGLFGEERCISTPNDPATPLRTSFLRTQESSGRLPTDENEVLNTFAIIVMNDCVAKVLEWTVAKCYSYRWDAVSLLVPLTLILQFQVSKIAQK
mgnify:CR=1 FL=1